MSVVCDALVLFGASGDLAEKKIYPALYDLAEEDKLPAIVVGVALTDWDAEGLRRYAREAIEEFGRSSPAGDLVERVTDALTYVRGDYREKSTYVALTDALGAADHPLMYLAIPPSLFTTVIDGLVEVGLHDNGRIVIEKPFGQSLESAKSLNACVLEAFPEDRVHRIDHFLGKEQVLDLLVFRLANTVLSPAWNRHYIDSVQITMAEDFGIDGRGAFYDETGALRDVVQNHLIQVLTQVAMEPPVSADARSLRDEKVKVLRSMTPLDPAEVVRGQFVGYRDEEGVAPDSDVETFVALCAHIESERWAGVPFFVMAGKHLPVTATDVLVEFKRPPRLFFTQADAAPPHPNHLLFRLKPGERVSLSVEIKEPGDRLVSRPVELDYDYDRQRDGLYEDAYARLLEDALDGEQRLFARADGVEEAWRVVQPVLDNPPPSRPYEPGTWGPAEADELIAAHGGWHRPELDTG